MRKGNRHIQRSPAGIKSQGKKFRSRYERQQRGVEQQVGCYIAEACRQVFQVNPQGYMALGSRKKAIPTIVYLSFSTGRLWVFSKPNSNDTREWYLPNTNSNFRNFKLEGIRKRFDNYSTKFFKAQQPIQWRRRGLRLLQEHIWKQQQPNKNDSMFKKRA